MPPDIGAVPCLRLAYDVLFAGGNMPVALNAANEVAVEAFLAGRLAVSRHCTDHRARRCRHTMCKGPTRWLASARRTAGRASTHAANWPAA